MPRKKDVMGYYMPSDKDREAYGWCINNGIYISPFANGEGAWYIDIKINNKTNRSPLTYGPTSIWIQMYGFYKYYYDKYAQKI